MTETSLVRLHTIVEGYVQGVGFRAFVENQANVLGLAGWVRNRWDGSVEVLAEGDRTSLERLLTALYRGPHSSQVTGVNPTWSEATGEFPNFRVRMTGG
jgi:acylphosphatase